MSKAIDCAKKIKKDLSVNWYELLEESNLHIIFGAIYNHLPSVVIEDKNRIICFLVYAYDPESGWIDLKKDRSINKKTILENLGADSSSELYTEIFENKNQIVSMCAFNFLESLKDWRWRMIYDLLDWASNNQMMASQETPLQKKFKKDDKEGKTTEYTEEVDIESVLKSNKLKGVLLDEAMSKRIQADKLLAEIQKDYSHTDHATNGDFGFNFTESAKKKDILSWRQYILSGQRKQSA